MTGKRSSASKRSLALLLAATCLACTAPAPEAPTAGAAAGGADPHSFARPSEVAVDHLELDLTVDFEQRRLTGRASLALEHREAAERLVLDTRGLEIRRVTRTPRGMPEEEQEAEFTLGEPDPILGRPLEIAITPDTEMVHVDYATTPEAAALQWLSPAQTDSGKPFLFTQSQAILARTWIPLQDTPGVRMTYGARIEVPPGLMAVMSAANPTETSPDGVYHFQMPQPIPAYLLALAVGDLRFRALEERSGVYAEPSVIDAAAWELADTGAMIDAAERLYGAYRWERYDVLVLPPSFPFGGMENPRLTFATPTILAGDRSLTALIAHELAHSWSGNLVTNATWNDFWLNEGFTVYFERRIMEELYGRPYAEMLASLGLGDLRETVGELGPASPDTRLHLDLAGRDPDEGMTDIAYEKGYFFLRRLEEAVGRERFDAFLAEYFERFRFTSMDTEGFLTTLREALPALAQDGTVDLERWVYEPGLPESLPEPTSAAFEAVEAEVAAFRTGTPAAALDTGDWTTHEWLHFLRHLPDELTVAEMAELDAAFALTDSGNAEILAAWLLAAVEHGYEPASGALERFLTGMGRRKFLRPLYAKLAETPEGLERARALYAEARPAYHPIARATIERILDDAAARGASTGGG